MQAGKAVVVASSYLPELLGLCDTIGVMSRGELAAVSAQPSSETAWSDKTDTLSWAEAAKHSSLLKHLVEARCVSGDLKADQEHKGLCASDVARRR